MNYKFGFDGNTLVQDFDNEIVLSIMDSTEDETECSLQVNNRDELITCFTRDWLAEHLENGGGSGLFIFECVSGSIATEIEFTDFDGASFEAIFDEVENIIFDK